MPEEHENIQNKPFTQGAPPADKTGLPAVPTSVSKWESRLNAIAARPRRHRALHWLTLVISLVSLNLPIIWLINQRTPLGGGWLWLDIGLSLFFAFEFFTRSGFQWNHSMYLRTHAFEIFAIIPVLVLTHYGVVYELVWVWLILVARAFRAVDRLLGDGFIERNVTGLIEGFEEEITDRVLLRIMARIQADLDRGQFGRGLAGALSKNKASLLKQVRVEHPQHGVAVDIARFVGLEAALSRAEENVFDSVTEFLGSAAVDKAIRELVDAEFLILRHNIAVKSWKNRIGLRPQS